MDSKNMWPSSLQLVNLVQSNKSLYTHATELKKEGREGACIFAPKTVSKDKVIKYFILVGL